VLLYKKSSLLTNASSNAADKEQELTVQRIWHKLLLPTDISVLILEIAGVGPQGLENLAF
jgi:hypothetical protein